LGGVVQAVVGAVGSGGALVRHERLEVGGLFDLRAAVEAARVGSDDVAGIEDTHCLERGGHEQRAVHVGMGDGIVVEVEAHVRCFAHADPDAFLGRERVVG